MPSLVKTGRGLLAQTGELMREAGLGGRAFIVTDSNVYAHYGHPLSESLAKSGYDPQMHMINAGEQAKNLRTLEILYDWLAGCRTERGDVIVALGGGVVGDLAGFLAATWLRGVPLVQVPTTLLAQVDSSIGGKTGVNLTTAKNLVGAFYQANLVVIDPAVLDSLPPREYRGGLGEVVKYGVIMDPPLFDLIESRQPDVLKQEPSIVDRIVGRCAELKLEVVGEDEREAGRRMILNFGHTIGHAIEAATNYEALLHGEAISIGMSGACLIAVALGKLPAATCQRLQNLLKGLGLPYAARGLAWEKVREAMGLDKKTRAGKINWILPADIGTVEICNQVPDDVVDDVLRTLLNA
ncbi:MAG TPA: 3-dehydroquinate synthase [Chloroflexota bacterium]|nr:3-dehydroquinate synthase [Chloroflexota bacterium]